MAGSSPSVAVIGLGNWGTALAHHLAGKGIDVVGWGREPEIAHSIATSHRNSLYLSDIELHPNVRATSSLTDTAGAQVMVLAFPSAGLEEILPQLAPREDTIIVSAIKGLEFSTRRTPLQCARSILGDTISLSVLSGPSFARDVVQRRPCGVVVASERESVARTIAELFTNETMRAYISTDPLGVELGGILKNVIALAVGVSDGLALGDSARAGLITRGLAEMMRFAAAEGADVRTLSGLSGLGDLAMTATSDLSRNRTVGLRLGRGESLDSIIKSLGSVAEGVRTTFAVEELARTLHIEMPITTHVAQLLRGEASAAEMARRLITRPVKPEFG